MATFDINLFALFALVLSLVMTLLAIAAFRSLEVTRRRLAERDAELKTVKSDTQEFRQKAAEAFADQKPLRMRVETLERTLGLTNEQLNRERAEVERLQMELRQLKTEYEATKTNLIEAYKKLREKPQP